VTVTNQGKNLAIQSLTITGANAGDFAQTNTCGSSLGAGASCTINITFTPTDGGTRTANLSVVDADPASPQVITLTGTGSTTPAVTITPSSLTFGNQGVGTSSPAQSVTLSNTGSASLSVTSIAVTGANAGDFTQTNSCGSSVAAGASCAINVVFNPAKTGTRSGNITISDNATPATQTVSLSGTGGGTAPAVTLTPASLTFGNQAVGTSSPAQSITLSNTGSASLSVSSIAVTGANAGDFTQTNNCGSSVAAGANCSINVIFNPTDTGSLSGSITISDNATPATQTVSLSGTASGSPAVTLTPTSLTFGNQAVGTSSPAQSIMLSNTGGASLSISSIAVTGANAGDFTQTNNCGSSVAAGANCSINVVFNPTDTGSRSGNITINDNATPATQTVSLSGTASGSPAVTLTPTSLSFASQGVGTSSPAQSVTLSNTGNASLSVSSITLTGANAGDFSQTNNCGSSVAAGASCSISVVFNPAAAGSRSGSITINDNATPATQTVSLSGTGSAAPAVTLTPTSLSFASQGLGTSSPAQSVTLSNTGNASLSVSSITLTGANAGDFSQTNNCGSSVAAGANCTIAVTFNPTAAGSRSASITINDNATPATQTVSLSGAGAQSQATLSPSSLSFGNQVWNTTAVSQAISLTNGGTAVLNIGGVTITGSNPADFAQTNTCGPSLTPGASCTINVSFTPQGLGARSGNVAVTDNAPGSPQTVSLTGTGLTSVSVAPTTVNLGSSTVGTASPAKTFTVTNLGGTALTIQNVTVGGANAGDFAVKNNCGSSLAAGAKCGVAVTFIPTASGSRSATVNINDSDPASPQQITVLGTGQ
jgi:phosphopantothenate synthetase